MHPYFFSVRAHVKVVLAVVPSCVPELRAIKYKRNIAEISLNQNMNSNVMLKNAQECGWHQNGVNVRWTVVRVYNNVMCCVWRMLTAITRRRLTPSVRSIINPLYERNAVEIASQVGLQHHGHRYGCLWLYRQTAKEKVHGYGVATVTKKHDTLIRV